MIIAETCPKCGADLERVALSTYPPIPVVRCPSCGWHHEEKMPEIMRVPYGGNENDRD